MMHEAGAIVSLPRRYERVGLSPIRSADDPITGLPGLSAR